MKRDRDKLSGIGPCPHGSRERVVPGIADAGE
jgi:hypothetical protein